MVLEPERYVKNLRRATSHAHDPRNARNERNERHSTTTPSGPAASAPQ
jgi:hypothetical protein